ncbi:hypothetical protein CSKR_111165 [Clonorchis sinensis]|uniref:Uncharacterized protein n=2 Tax=Clonorchis sinensis TaxID=79923 RepID=G7YK00_CLOSI|nr:hypothetical protein CSKR_111165 [Clonorchis sinensis]GAA53283.1 hypothetical protein CLF_109936 [Clonorchis sinensis]
MTEMIIHRWDPAKDGELSLQSMLKKLKSEGCGCVDYEFSPGTSFPEHTHAQDKMDCIVSGQLWFKMFDKEVILGPGDRLEVPRNTPHSARVHGNQKVVFVDATRR